MRERRRGSAAIAVLIGAATFACAARQHVPLDCLPAEVTVYIDGERLAETPDALELDPAEPHVVMFRGEGYASQMVVLETREDAEGRPVLVPESLCIELVPVGMDRQLEIEIEGTPRESP